MTLAQQLKSMSLPGTPAYRAAEAMEAAEGALSEISAYSPDIEYAVAKSRAALAKLRGEA
ncbi:MAG: hypothetical protein ING29_00810 [Azospirillum sp.]|jgi:hypothetical protein|nr:hypothetical protein [Azospirillum sp.]